MTLYTIKWTETKSHEIDLDSVGPDEALEEFWVLYNSADDSTWNDENVVETDGPNDIEVVWLHGHIDPQQKQEEA